MQTAFIDAGSHLPPLFNLIWRHSVGGTKEIMLLLQSLLPFQFYSNPGPQTTRPSCHFLGLSENASSFSGQRKKNVRYSFFPFFFGWRPRITYPELKTKRHDEKVVNVINGSFSPFSLVRSTSGGCEEAAPECEDPLQPRPGGRRLHVGTHAGGENWPARRAFSSVPEGCMMEEPLSNSLLTVKHKVSGSDRETPTFISFTAIPVGRGRLKETKRYLKLN